MILKIVLDALFAAIASIGFAAISRPPRRAYVYCAMIAAVGHSLRFMLMTSSPGLHIIPSTAIAAFIIGILAVGAASMARFPAETCLFPALLPMIPGVYAYKTFGGAALCLLADSPEAFARGFYLFAFNAMTCCAILLCMVIGATLPIFLFKKIAFQATR